MRGLTAKRLGLAMIFIGSVPALLLPVLWLLGGWLRAAAGWALGFAALVSLVLAVWVAYRFWRAADGTAGEPFMKWGLILGIAIPVAVRFIDNAATSLLHVRTSSFVERSWPYSVAALTPILLLTIGLLVVRWVPPWIPRLGVVTIALTAVLRTPLAGALPAQVSRVVDSGLLGLQAFVLIAMGVALLLRSSLPESATEQDTHTSRTEQALPADGGSGTLTPSA